MKKQNRSYELKSSERKVERSRLKADDIMKKGQGRFSRTHVLHRSRQFASGNVLEAAGEYREIGPDLWPVGQVAQVSKVLSTREIAREEESWGSARFHLEKVMGNKHSRSP